MEVFIRIIEWLIPAGGLAGGLAWLLNKTLRNLRKTKEIHDTYKTLYEHISQTILSLQDEITGLHKELSRFRRAISKAANCHYFDDCPVQQQLSEQTVDTNPAVDKRQHTRKGRKNDVVRSDTGVAGKPGDTC